MYCPSCGKKNEDNASQCVGCGGNLYNEAPAQPGIAPQQPGSRPDIPNYLVQSILVTLFCCLPCGIAAIVFAAQVNGKIAAGDIVGAMQSSKKAKMFCWIAFGLGLAMILIQVLLGVMGVGFSAVQYQQHGG